MRAALLGSFVAQGGDKEEQEWIALLFDAFEPVPYSPSIMRKTNVATVRMVQSTYTGLSEPPFQRKKGVEERPPGSGGAYVEEAVEEHHGEGPAHGGLAARIVNQV